jgi:type IV pilus assembly protein PilC
LVVIGYLIRKLLQNEEVQARLDRMQLKIPLFGVLFEKVYMARFTRTMSTLLASGVPMLHALETARRATNNRAVQADLDIAITKVRGGIALSEALDESPTFLSLVPQMIGIGEQSGATDDMMARVAGYYEAEVDDAVKNLSTTLEPIMMVVLGVIVAVVLGAVLYPVYSLVGSGSIN